MRAFTKSGLPSEQSEQIAFIRWASYQPFYKNIFAIENGGSRSSKLIRNKNGGVRKVSIEGLMLKKKGVKAGVSDLFLALPSNSKNGMFIEMKTIDGGRVSSEQKDFLSLMSKAGYHAVVACGWRDAALKVCDYLGQDTKGLL